MLKISILSLLFLFVKVNGANIECIDEYHESLWSLPYPFNPEDCDYFKEMFKGTNLKVTLDCHSENNNFLCTKEALDKYGFNYEYRLAGITLENMGIEGNLNLDKLPARLDTLLISGNNFCGNSTINPSVILDISISNCTWDGLKLICPPCKNYVTETSLVMFISSIGLYFFTKNLWISLAIILFAIIYYFSFGKKDKRD